MPRKIVRIDEDRCDGCGVCVTACAEGALAIVDGKARLTGEIFCDGFGDCVGECPQGAMTIVEEDAPAYDPIATRARVGTIGGAEAVRRFDEAARAHSGCPGSRMSSAPGVTQWPIQLHLVPPQAPFFRGKELVVLNPCGAVASRNLHETILDGRSVVVGCPKLDDTRPYAAKLAAILSDPALCWRNGVLATFDGPGRAIRCAHAISSSVNDLGIKVRAGLHTGECELLGTDIGGIAVHIAARVAAQASAGEVMVSSTVKDLVAGSGIQFEDRGSRALKGVPEEWRLFMART